MKRIQLMLLAIALFFLGFTNVYGEVKLTDDMATLKELLKITDKLEYIPDKSGFKTLVISSEIEGIEYIAYKHVSKDVYGFGVRTPEEAMLIHWNLEAWYILYAGNVLWLSPDHVQIEWSSWVKMVNEDGDLNNIHPIELTGAIRI